MSDTTLTLTASGPARFVRDIGDEKIDATATHEAVTIEATYELDEDTIDSVIYVYRQGAVLSRKDVVTFVRGRLDESGGTYDPLDHREWEVQLDGRVDTWINLAVMLADDRMAYDSEVPTLACQILDSLSEFGDDRPRLAMLDLVTQYDVDGLSREDFLEELSDSTTPDADDVEEVPADD